MQRLLPFQVKRFRSLCCLTLLFGLSAVAFSARAQTPAYVFTKLVDSNDLLPGSDGVFYRPNQQPTFDGATVAFWNGQNLGYDSIWSVRAGGSPLRLVDLNTDVPGGTGKFTAFLIDFSGPGYLFLRNGTLIFAGRDAATSGYTGGLYAVPAAGGAVTRLVNRNVPAPDGSAFIGGLQNFSLDAGRVAFFGVTGGGSSSMQAVYAVNSSGTNLVTLADSAHPAHPEFNFQVNLFNLPAISGGNVAFYGQSVFDPFSGYNAFYTTASTGGFAYGEPVTSGNQLPGNTNANFHTRLAAPRLDGDNLFFAADDSFSNPNYFGLYRGSRTEGALTRIADRNSVLPGLSSVLSFGNYAASGSQLAFSAISPTNQGGIYVGDGSTLTKVVASGDAGPFADTLGTVEGVEIGASAFMNGQLAVRLFSPFSAYGIYLAAPFAQSADLGAALAASPGSPTLGATTTLTLTVTNAGPAAATSPVGRLALPPGLTFQSASSGGTLDASGAVVFNLATIPSGGSVSVTAVARVDAPGTLTASAYVNGANADSNRRNNHAFLSVPAPGPRPSNYVIRKIIDTQTAIPDRPGQFFGVPGGNDPLPALDGGRVGFVAVESNAAAVWTANTDGSGLTRIATTATEAIPGYPGEKFTFFALPRLRNGTFAFYGGNDLRHNGFYAVPASGGAFGLVVNTSSTRPDRSQPFDFVSSFVSGFLGDGRLTFSAQDTLYAWPVGGGVGTAVVPSGTNVPVGGRGSGQFFPGGISGTRVAFGSTRNDVHLGFLDERRFETAAAARLTISPSDPAGGAFSDSFGGVDGVQVDGPTVVFRAFSGANNSIRGLYAITGNAPPVTLVDNRTPVPGGTGNFSNIDFGGSRDSFSLNAGQVVFIGTDGGNDRPGIYSVAVTGGTITRVVAVGDAAGTTSTRVITGFSQPPLQGNALGQRQVAFRADYADPSTNTGGSGFFVASPTSRLINISTRVRVETGDNVGIAGFVLRGGGSKRVIVRAIGPTLTQFGVPGALADPVLTLKNSAGVTVATNDSWKSTQQAEIIASGFPPMDDRECAIVATLQQGSYTAIVNGAGGTSGVALVEVYDLDTAADIHLINISTRGRVLVDDEVMIGGFVIGGTESKRVVVRAIGPNLANFGVPGVLANPTVQLFTGGILNAMNDDWKTTQQAEIVASGFAPSNDLESAIVVTLPPGPYTAVVSGVGRTSGVGLVEVYELP